MPVDWLCGKKGKREASIWLLSFLGYFVVLRRDVFDETLSLELVIVVFMFLLETEKELEGFVYFRF